MVGVGAVTHSLRPADHRKLTHQQVIGDRFLVGQDGPLAKRTGDELAAECRRAVWRPARATPSRTPSGCACSTSRTILLGAELPSTSFSRSASLLRSIFLHNSLCE